MIVMFFSVIIFSRRSAKTITAFGRGRRGEGLEDSSSARLVMRFSAEVHS